MRSRRGVVDFARLLSKIDQQLRLEDRSWEIDHAIAQAAHRSRRQHAPPRPTLRSLPPFFPAHANVCVSTLPLSTERRTPDENGGTEGGTVSAPDTRSCGPAGMWSILPVS